jgi:uncharacterized protein (TIGR04222 family)
LVSVEAATLGLGAVLAATMVVSLVMRSLSVRSGSAEAGELALYQIAMLAGGPQRVSDTALSYLTWSGIVEVRESTDRLVRVVAKTPAADIHPIETSILNAIDIAGVKPGAAMAAGRRAAARHVEGLDGLVVSPASLRISSLVVALGCGAVVGGTAWWIAATGSPTTGFVPLVALTALVYAGWWLSHGRPRITGVGAEALDRLRARLDPDLQIAAIGVTSLPLERAMTVIAVYGRDALTGQLSALRKVMTGNPAPSVLVARSSLGR